MRGQVRLAAVPRSGFTLVEILVALVVGSVVLYGARLMLEQVGDAGHRINEAAVSADARANGDRLMRQFFDRLEVGSDLTIPFGGDAGEVRFSSWCDMPAGWQERCVVRLAIDRTRKDVARLVAHLSTGESLPLRDLDPGAELRYLDDPSAGGRWFVAWGAGIIAPLAIAVVSAGDTLIVRIGERG